MTTALFLRRALILVALLAVGAASAQPPTRSFDLPAGSAEASLKRFSRQAGIEVVFPTQLAASVRTPAIKGDYAPLDAITQLLRGTPLLAQVDQRTGAIVVTHNPASDPNVQRAAPRSDRPRADDIEEKKIVLDTFEVMGSKLLNMDVPRSRDDAQPYVVFDRERIEQSGATDLESFLKNRLTMNTQSGVGTQSAGNLNGNLSQINLRGLGIGQTLILIDGHRATGVEVFGTSQQSDINWIPLAAVQRIEVLPTTASGIFGGSATGGVVNIILRRDYSGAELKLTYENTFHGDAPLRRADLSAGFSLEDGRTTVLLAAGFSDSSTPTVGDRDFLVEGRARVLANNPSFFLNAANPPLGATPNIRSANSSNLVLKNGNVALNSPITFVPIGYVGVSSDNGAALVANAGKYNFTPSPTNQAVLGATKLGLFTEPRVESLMATVRRRFTDRIEGFVDASMANNRTELPFNFSTGSFALPATSPANPFTQAVNVTIPVNSSADSTYSFSNYDRRVVGGVVVKLDGDWKAEADYTWNTSRYSFFNPQTFLSTLAPDIASGVIPIVRDVFVSPPNFAPYLAFPSNWFVTPMKSTLRDLAVRASGPVFELPAGRPTLSGLLEWRDERLHEGYQAIFQGTTPSYIFRPSRGQSILSAYLETQVPLFSPEYRLPLLESLSLQVAARIDEYTLDGADSSVSNLPSLTAPIPPINRREVVLQSVDPTIGLRYEPIAGVVLRASYGTGFLPPTPSQLISIPANPLVATMPVNDPRRGNQTTLITSSMYLRTGGNPGLRPEESESVSAGVILQPRFLANLRLSVDYTHIEKTDIITTLVPQGVVDNEAFFPERVQRNPATAGDPFGVGTIAAIDTTAVNLSSAVVEAFDVALDYTRRTDAFGSFSFFAQATWQTHYQTQSSPIAPFIENVGINSTSPLKFKANGGLTWRHGPWTANWLIRYFDSYYAANPSVVSSGPTLLNQGDGGIVPSQYYHDASVSYRFAPRGDSSSGFLGRLARAFSRTELQLGIKNLLDDPAPFDAGTSPRYYSAFGDARLRSYYVSVRTAF
jgi:iron complex outermembrane recepter protein